MAEANIEGSDAQAVKNLSGLERSALLMLGLGEKHAAEILRHMGPKEVQEIGLAMAGLTQVTNSQMELVMQKFVDTIGEQTSLGMGSDGACGLDRRRHEACREGSGTCRARVRGGATIRRRRPSGS